MKQHDAELLTLLDSIDSVLLATGQRAPNPNDQQLLWIVDAEPAVGFAALLKRSLAFFGKPNAQEITIDTLDSIDLNTHKTLPFLISLSLGGEASAREESIARWCEKHVVPWVRIALDTSMGYADAGPVFLSGYTPCYKCFADVYLKEHCKARKRHPCLSALALWSNLLASSVVDYSTLCFRALVPDGFKRYNVTTLMHEELRRTFLPSCKCRFTEATSGALQLRRAVPNGHSYAALIFEDCASKEYLYHGIPRSTAYFVDRSLAIQPFPNSHSQSLPSPPPLEKSDVADFSGSETLSRSKPLAVEDLAAVLFYSVGIRSIDLTRINARRWAASAGNLGSAEISILNANIQGIGPGFYHYRATTHDLIDLRLRRLGSDLERLLHNVTEGAMLCFVGLFHRLQQKYGAFGYRLVHLDAGVAFSQASMVARSLGCQLLLLSSINEADITKCFNLSRGREYLTAVGHLSVAKREPDRKAFGPGDGVIRHGSDWMISAEPPLMSQHLLHSLFLESMRTAQSDFQVDVCGTSEKKTAVMRRETSSTVDRAQHMDLLDVLSRRTSGRTFAQKDVPQSTMMAMVKYAYEADSSEWPESALHQTALRFFILQTAKEGSKTLYEYRRNADELGLVKRIPPSDISKPLYVDPCFQEAPLAVWIIGDLAKAIEAHGSYGHRQLLFRAGAAANRLWLTAISLGLAGTIAAGLLPRIARQVLGFDGWQSLPLCAFLGGFDERTG